MDDMMLISLAFVVGFILGGLIAFIAMTKFSAKHKLIDEMTKIKRANANKDRMIVEFFENAQEQFSLLNKVYINYAKFMQSNAERFVPQETEFLDDNQQDLTLKVKKAPSDKTKAFVPETDTKESFIPEVEPKIVPGSAQSSTENTEANAKDTANVTVASEDKDATDDKLQENTPKAQDVAKSKDDSMDKIIDDMTIARIADAAASARALNQDSDNLNVNTDAALATAESKAQTQETEPKEQAKI